MIVYTLTEAELPKDFREKVDSIDRSLKEILMWTRFANILKLKDTLDAELDTNRKKLAYENTDGENGLKEWWPRWFRLGIVTESEARKGRMVKIVSLEDVGIEVPRKKAKASRTP